MDTEKPTTLALIRSDPRGSVPDCCTTYTYNGLGELKMCSGARFLPDSLSSVIRDLGMQNGFVRLWNLCGAFCVSSGVSW